MKKIAPCLILMITIFQSGLFAQSLIALSKADHMLVILDPATLNILARIPVGNDPHEVIASDDGKKAYVSIYGGGSLHEINIIDLVGRKPLQPVDTRPLYGPHGMAYSSGKVWFSAEGSKSVGSFDPASGKFDWSMGTGQDRTHMLYVSADAKKIYTANVNGGTVSILEAPSASGNSPVKQEWSQTIVQTVKGSEGFDVSPDQKELWTASSTDGTISIVDLSAKNLSAKIDAKVNGANRVKFTTDGRMVFISSLQSGELTIYDAKTRKETKRLKLGKGAAGILMDPSAARAFVACSADNYIAVIDLKSLEVVKKLNVGGTPDGLAWAVKP